MPANQVFGVANCISKWNNTLRDRHISDKELLQNSVVTTGPRY